MTRLHVPGLHVPGPAALRAVVADAAWLAVRRTRVDRWPPAVLHLVVALAALLAVAGPQLLDRATTLGLQDAVARAGDAADVRVDVRVVPEVTSPTDFDGTIGTMAPLTPERVRKVTDEVVLRLPAAVRAAAGPLVTVVESGERVQIPPRAGTGGGTGAGTGAGAAGTSALLRLAYLPGPDAAVRYVRGSAPADPPGGKDPQFAGPVPVALSSAVAAALHLQPGDVVRCSEPGWGPAVTLRVTGLFAPVAPGAPVWRQVADALAPERAPDRPVLLGTALVGDAVASLQAGLRRSDTEGVDVWIHVRQGVDAHRITAALADPLMAGRGMSQIAPGLTADPHLTDVSVGGGLPDLLAAHSRRAHAAAAVLSLAVAGVVGAAGVVILLAAGLVVHRRAPALALVHARGASLTAVAVGTVLEFAPPALLACAAGAVTALTAFPGVGSGTDAGIGIGSGSWPPPAPSPDAWAGLAAVLALATLGPAGLAARTARAAWRRPRLPAGRRAVAAYRSRTAARRAVLQGLVAVLAVAAVVALRGRGLAGSGPAGVDPLLAAAPLLVAVALTLVVARAYPWPVRVVAALARRRPGAVAAVGWARAATAVTLLPLLGLAVCAGLAVSATALRATLPRGLEQASWERTGADVRVEAALADADVAALRRASGVTAVASARVRRSVPSRVGDRYDDVTLLAVDTARFAGILARLPGSGSSGSSEGSGSGDLAASLARLTAASPAGAGPVALVDPGLAARLGGAGVQVNLGGEMRPVHVVGSVSLPVRGWEDGPLVIVDRDVLRSRVPAETGDTVAWVEGPGADAAVAALPGLTARSVHSRAAWLHDVRDTRLLVESRRVLDVATVAIGVFAAAALLATVVGGSGERARALATLRTLGLTAAQARRVAVTEVAPLLVTGVVTGLLGGLTTVALLGPALGMGELTRQVSATGPTVPAGDLALVVGGLLALAALAVAVESVTARRLRPAQVLRLGEGR